VFLHLEFLLAQYEYIQSITDILLPNGSLFIYLCIFVILLLFANEQT
jgi:hypothetical protein